MNIGGFADWSAAKNRSTKGSPWQEGVAPTTKRGNRLWGVYAICFGLAVVAVSLLS
jgi:hypothetical protein